jgi:secernin
MCDTFVSVLPDRVIFGKNSDRDPGEAQVINYLPRRHYMAGSALRCTWISIPQADVAFAVLLSRPFWMWGAEMGVNEHGVVIGNEAVFTDQPLRHQGLTGMDLLRLALERSTTAEEATTVITRLIEEHGQGGRCGYTDPGFRYHNSFLIADYRGAWVLETADQKIAIEKVSGARAISNGLTIPSLCKHADKLRGGVAQCKERRSRVETLASAVEHPRDAMRVLRDHGEGNQHPHYRRLNGAMAAPCVHAGGLIAGSQTVGSWVSELTPNGAKHFATGTSAPCWSMFRPVMFAETFAESSELWWSFEGSHRALLRSPEKVPSSFVEERDALEQNIGDASYQQKANDWLRRWREWSFAHELPEERPRWLARYWRNVATQDAQGPRMPWRDPEHITR